MPVEEWSNTKSTERAPPASATGHDADGPCRMSLSAQGTNRASAGLVRYWAPTSGDDWFG